MITKNGRKYKRTFGNPRKDIDIYATMGPSSDIIKKKVVFVGDNGESLCLTKGKEYEIINIKFGKCFFEEKLMSYQYDKHLLILINDKDRKRQYNHNLFKLVKEVKESFN